VVAGYYDGPNFTVGGFLRAAGASLGFRLTRAGVFTTISAPGAGTIAQQGTTCRAINPSGVVTGNYADASYVAHGFVVSADGAITTFDAPRSLSTAATSINAAGAITGSYQQSGSHAYRGFLRSPGGAFDTFQVPGARGTDAIAINSIAVIAGQYSDSSDNSHGFLRIP
jgi:hypothetical protein